WRNAFFLDLSVIGVIPELSHGFSQYALKLYGEAGAKGGVDEGMTTEALKFQDELVVKPDLIDKLHALVSYCSEAILEAETVLGIDYKEIECLDLSKEVTTNRRVRAIDHPVTTGTSLHIPLHRMLSSFIFEAGKLQ